MAEITLEITDSESVSLVLNKGYPLPQENMGQCESVFGGYNHDGRLCSICMGLILNFWCQTLNRA